MRAGQTVSRSRGAVSRSSSPSRVKARSPDRSTLKVTVHPLVAGAASMRSGLAEVNGEAGPAARGRILVIRVRGSGLSDAGLQTGHRCLDRLLGLRATSPCRAGDGRNRLPGYLVGEGAGHTLVFPSRGADPEVEPMSIESPPRDRPALLSPPRLRPFGTRPGALAGFALRLVLVAGTYYVAGRLSLRLSLVQRQVTPIWPPTGIAVVALLLVGRRVWPAIAVAAFLLNAPIGPTPLVAAAIAAGNTLAPLLAATLLKRAGFRPELDRLRDALALVFLGALLSMTVSATVGTIALASVRRTSTAGFWGTWSVWWAGDAMGVLVVAPFLLTLRGVRRPRGTSWRRWAEVSALLAGTGLVAFAILHSRLRVEYLVFPLLGWAAWRFGQRGAAPAALITSAIAIWAAVDGTGPFAGLGLAQKMVTLQVFNASVALASFVLAALLA
ncbi:MAG: hypothetical protein E6G66_00740, partial [Actinobacteria bacterium]